MKADCGADMLEAGAARLDVKENSSCSCSFINNDMATALSSSSWRFHQLPLCGREKELQALDRQFESCSLLGTSAVVVISGKAGIVESSLIEAQREYWK
jgi:hypothetical protein